MARYQVQGPDGQIHVFEGPDGATPEQVIAVAQQTFGAAAPAQQAAAPSLVDKIKQGAGNAVAGAVRGAGSIGATLLAPIDMASDALDGKGLSLESNRQRRADMDSALQQLGADPDSLLYKGGKLAGEVAGTAGAGGVVANGARALGASPALAGAIESAGFAGGGNPVIRAVGGAINGAATAGLVDPSQAKTGAVVGAVLPTGVKVAGKAGEAISNGMQEGAKRLMQSAIKPTIAQRKSGDAATAIDTLLEYGINPTKAGVEKLRTLIDDLNNQISSAVGSSNATVSKQKVLDALNDVRAQFSTQVSPTKDLAAIQGVADDFVAHPGLPPGNAIPVQQAQQMKQGTYRVLSKKYGEVGSAETEAQKGLARGLKEEIAQAVPGVDALNAQESKLLTTLSVAERRALLEANKNPMGLAALAHNPLGWAAFMADRSAAFKALAARMVNAATPAPGAASQALLGAASNPLLRASGLVASEATP